jgi:ubiquinone biosynthesis protein COQ9
MENILENNEILEEIQKQEFLDKVIELVQLSKWSDEILEEACCIMGLNPIHYYIWFPGGTNEILSFLEAKYDQEMLEIIKPAELNGVTNKIAFALKTRILKTSKPKLLSIKNSYHYIKPANFAHGIKLAATTADLIWRYAGDTSIDFNYYSKRILLQGVYLSSQTYYYCDYSKNNINTQKFIERSLNQIVSSAKCLKQVPNCLNKIPIVRMFL